MGHDSEPIGGPWSLLFDLLAVAAGAGATLLLLHWLGLAIPLLPRLGFA